MNENKGFIKLYRRTLDNPIVTSDNDCFRVWIQLLLMANHSNKKMMFGKEVVEVSAGELITGRDELAKKCNISSSKVERILKKLKSGQQIEQRTCSYGRLISIVNWNMYQQSEQQSEQQVNNEWTTSEQQVNTNKNVRMKEIYIERNNNARAREGKIELFDYDWMNDDEN